MRNATVLSCTRLAVASMAYHELKHHHGLRNKSAKVIASATIKVVSAAIKKVNGVLSKLSPAKEKAEIPRPITAPFANVSHFQSTVTQQATSTISPQLPTSDASLIIGNALCYPSVRGKSNSFLKLSILTIRTLLLSLPRTLLTAVTPFSKSSELLFLTLTMMTTFSVIIPPLPFKLSPLLRVTLLRVRGLLP